MKDSAHSIKRINSGTCKKLQAMMPNHGHFLVAIVTALREISKIKIGITWYNINRLSYS